MQQMYQNMLHCCFVLQLVVEAFKWHMFELHWLCFIISFSIQLMTLELLFF
uniref:Uncharacterized protein n=1 Tax=Rhizophora mucronata TaxID=61149 RepID=A0A2P2QMM9_RHIMU